MGKVFSSQFSYELECGPPGFPTKNGTNLQCTLPETKRFAAENRPKLPQKETIVFQPSIFRCKLLVSGRVSLNSLGVVFYVEGFPAWSGCDESLIVTDISWSLPSFISSIPIPSLNLAAKPFVLGLGIMRFFVFEGVVRFRLVRATWWWGRW